MTDKQIIIDGIDVSGCEFATKAEMVCDTHCRLYDYEYCIGKDCHYKNWQRKEQECEELKDKLNCCFCNPYVELNDIEKQRKCVEVTECFRRQLDQLKADNKHLNDLLNQALKELEEMRELKDTESLQAYILTRENERLKELLKSAR